ncbi:MAG: hypothetical protein ACKVRN_05715 [Pyrinomonadaceae bacterium]
MSHIKIVFVVVTILLFNIAVLSQSHRDRWIHYVSCDDDLTQPIKENDGRVVNRKWKADFKGDFAFHHFRGNDATEGKDDDGPLLRYLTLDGTCWEARWESATNVFVHRSVKTGEVRRGNVIGYLTWDLSKWKAQREGNEFVHTFLGGKEYEKTILAKMLKGLGDAFVKGDAGIYPRSDAPKTSQGATWGAVKWICSDDPLPRGWIVTEVDAVPSPDCKVGTRRKSRIFDTKNAPIGWLVDWCAHSTLPPGWEVDKDASPYGRPGKCGGWNQWTVRRVR